MHCRFVAIAKYDQWKSNNWESSWSWNSCSRWDYSNDEWKRHNRQLQTFNSHRRHQGNDNNVVDDSELSTVDHHSYSHVAMQTMTIRLPTLDEYYVVFLWILWRFAGRLSVASLNIFSLRCSHPPSCHSHGEEFTLLDSWCSTYFQQIHLTLDNILCLCNKFHLTALDFDLTNIFYTEFLMRVRLRMAMKLMEIS